MKKQNHDLFAEHHRPRKITQFTKVLDSLSGLVDWAALTKLVIERTGREASQPKGGRDPSTRPKRWSRLSFCSSSTAIAAVEDTEHALLDRGSWQRFIGMADTRDLPDVRTIWHFKNQLAQTGSTSELFADLQRQLNAAGLVAKGGQMMDATIVPSPKMHLTKAEKETIAKGKAPAHWPDKQAAHKDTDAHWSAKRGYDSAANRQTLKANKLRAGVARNDDCKRYDQTDIDVRNLKLSCIRARMAHVFGAWAKVIGKSIRCLGLARTKAQITMQAIVVTLRRWVTFDGHGGYAA